MAEDIFDFITILEKNSVHIMAKDRQKLIHIHSSIPNKQPKPEILEMGELAVNNSAGNEFISTLSSNGTNVVRFSCDKTVMEWVEKKEVMPIGGEVQDVDLEANTSALKINLNQAAGANTPGNISGDSFTIDMSQYTMMGGNPSFSSLTANGNVYVNGVGGYDGQDASSANTLQEVIATLTSDLYKANAVVTLTANPSLIEKNAGVNSIKVSYSVSYLGAPITPKAVTLMQGSKQIQIAVGSTGETTVEGVTDTTDFTINVEFVDGVFGMAAARVDAMYPMYFGHSSKTALTSSDVIGFGAYPTIKKSPAGDYVIENLSEGDYIWLCVPEEMTINKVTSYGFEIPMMTPDTIEVTDKGRYKCYRNDTGIKGGDVEITIY